MKKKKEKEVKDRKQGEPKREKGRWDFGFKFWEGGR